MTGQQILELRNKLDVAIFGIETFITTTELNLELCRKMSSETECRSIESLLTFIKDIDSRLKEMP